MHPVERTLWTVAAVASLVLATCALWIAWQDAEAVHDAQCAQRAYVQRQMGDTQDFLKMTKAERSKQYGSIGDIPDAALQRSLARYQAQLRTTDNLGCS